MYDIVVVSTIDSRVVFNAGNFSTRIAALEDASEFLLSIIPHFMRVKLEYEKDGVHLYQQLPRKSTKKEITYVKIFSIRIENTPTV